MNGFRICSGKGFHIGFENGYTVSVQFGPGNYCEHYDREIGRDAEDCGKEGSVDAEVAILNPEGDLITIPAWGDEVKGYVSPSEVVNLLEWARNQ